MEIFDDPTFADTALPRLSRQSESVGKTRENASGFRVCGSMYD